MILLKVVVVCFGVVLCSEVGNVSPGPPYAPCGSCRQTSLPPDPPYALWFPRDDWYIILKRVGFWLSPSGSRHIVRVVVYY